jgi:hypothetical protein
MTFARTNTPNRKVYVFINNKIIFLQRYIPFLNYERYEPVSILSV